VVNFMPRPLYPRGKSHQYPLDRRLGGPQSRSGRFGEGKILYPTETRTPSKTESVIINSKSRLTIYPINRNIKSQITDPLLGNKSQY
jgi:hypothetical protein